MTDEASVSPLQVGNLAQNAACTQSGSRGPGSAHRQPYSFVELGTDCLMNDTIRPAMWPGPSTISRRRRNASSRLTLEPETG